MKIQQAIAELIEGRNLDLSSMHDVMVQIMTGAATQAQIGAFLVALRIKGETSEEIEAARSVRQSHRVWRAPRGHRRHRG